MAPWCGGVEEGELQAAGFVRGVHYHRLESDLSRLATGYILNVLERPEILGPLRRRPISNILITRLRDQGISGAYLYPEVDHFELGASARSSLR